MDQLTPFVKKLLLLNVGLFLGQRFLGLDVIDTLGLRCVLSPHFMPYQFLAHLFVHADSNHLISNMFALVTFGPVLERTLGTRRFITFYLLTGLGAAALYAGLQYIEVGALGALYRDYLAQPDPASFAGFLGHFSHETYNAYGDFTAAFWQNPDELAYIAKSKAIIEQLYMLKANIPTVGASGAVFGILTAFAMLFPNAELYLYFIPYPVKAKYLIVAYGLYELYAGIKDSPTDNVAHFVHLGGILLAYLFIKWCKKKHYC